MIAIDTSVAVPALLSWHEAHDRARLAAKDAPIPSHALLETYSVLTRLPQPLSAGDAARLLGLTFTPDRILSPPRRIQRSVVATCAEAGLTGGAVYDAFIGLTAQHHGLTLLTRDRRATRTYLALGVEFVLDP